VDVTHGKVEAEGESKSHSDYRSAVLHVGVADNGIGIGVDDLEFLFQAYGQVRPAVLQTGNGSGLGLSICKKLVELLGGNIGVRARKGQGYTIHYYYYSVYHIS
jgi:signal transduction histidine kinase